MTPPPAHHPEFATGAARYAGDMAPPGVLAMVVVRSPVAHGGIVGLDTTAAKAVPGVVAVLTASDLEGMPTLPIRSFATPSLEAIRQPVLARDVVRYVGEPIAIVVAPDRGQAAAAAELVRLRIAPLDAVVDVASAPQMCRTIATDGDIDDVFAHAARVTERTMSSARHTGLPLEPRTLIARWADGGLELWGITKFIDHSVATIAEWFRIPPSRIRVNPLAVGGMFGVRGELYPEDYLVPWAAQQVGCPVIWVEDRVEHLAAINHAPAIEAVVSVAIAADGTLTGLRARLMLDMGAYPRGNGERLVMLAAEELVGPYAWQALSIEAVGVRTNATPTGSVRAPVASEAGFFRETTIDAVAGAAGIAADLVRARSVVPAALMPFRREYGPGLHAQLYDGGDFPAFLEGLAPTLARYAAAVSRRREEGDIAGSGIAVFLAHSGVSASEKVTLDLTAGRVIVHTSLSEVGQGLDQVLRMTAGQALGVSADLVDIRSGTVAPHGPGRGTFSSRSTIVAANACHDAATQLVSRIRARLAVLEECPVERVRTVPGGFVTPRGTITWAHLPFDERAVGSFADPEPLLGIGAHVARVSIDAVTGRVEVDEITVAYDCGAMIDPDGVRGQLLGGTAHGIGIALTESLGDASSSARTRSLLQYRLPTAMDVPAIDVMITEGGTSRNALGAKGAGEAGVIGAPAAIANAVADALHCTGGEGAPMLPDGLPIRESWVRAAIRDGR